MGRLRVGTVRAPGAACAGRHRNQARM